MHPLQKVLIIYGDVVAACKIFPIENGGERFGYV